MLHWLVGNCDVFGFSAQNWMLVVAGVLLIYVLTLVLGRQKRARLP